MIKKFIYKRNFTIIFLVFTAAVIIGGGTFLYKSVSKIKSDYNELNSIAVKNMSLLMDSAFDESVMITANIAIDNYVTSYVFSSNSEEIFDDIGSKVRLKLDSYVGINDYIQSAYVYSGDGKVIRTDKDGGDSAVYVSSQYLEEISAGFSDDQVIIVPPISSNNEIFCVCKKMSENGKDGYVILNINMRKLISVLADRSIEYSYYIHSGDEILYSRNGRDIFLKDGVLKTGFHKDSRNMYNVSSVQSEKYEWSYARGEICDGYRREMLLTVVTNLLVILLLVFFSFIAAYLISERMSRPLKSLSLLFSGDTQLDEKMDEDVRIVAEKILNLINSNDSLKKELELKIAQLNDNRIANLQAQINPHFLYNSLNIINWTVWEEAGEDSKSLMMISTLADLLAYTTNLSDVFVRLSDEIHYTGLYVDLLKYRYNNSFEAVFDIPPELCDMKTVKLCLQPIIENSVYHGFGKNTSDKLIEIKAERRDEDVFLIIKDNGTGIPEEKMTDLLHRLDDSDGLLKEHIGLANVKNRMKLLYGNDAEMIISSVPGEGTTVTLKFRYEEFINQ